MRKIVILCVAGALLSSACSNKKQEEQLRQAQALADASREELVGAVADRDSLLGLVNEISAGMGEIRRLENILTVNNASETPGQRDQIRADISAIQQALQQRRERLKELERKLANSNITNSKLQATITTLREQIDTQTQEIAGLRANLDDAKSKIGTLDQQVDSLSTTVNTVKAQRDSANQVNTELVNELNTCYYAIGNKSELKANRIIEGGGFLRKTKLMEGDFDRSFFTKADKRTLTTIDLNSSKAEVLTKQPEGSYTITNEGGRKVLHITNPAEFWSLSNFLVIKID